MPICWSLAVSPLCHTVEDTSNVQGNHQGGATRVQRIMPGLGEEEKKVWGGAALPEAELSQPSFHVNNLGLHFDSCMTFNTHVSEITKKTMGTLIFINRHKNLFNKETRIMIVQTLALSIIKYCITIWGTTNSTLINKVQKLQNFAIKVADGKARKYGYVTSLFNDLQWLKIKDLITFSILTRVFKQKIEYYPDHILSLPAVNYKTDSRTK